jgi:hypothetical protein
MIDQLSQRAQSDVIGFLYKSAEENAKHTNGLIVAYPPDQFEYQTLFHADRTNTTHMRSSGILLPPEKIDSVAGLVDSRYKNIPEFTKQRPDLMLSFGQMATLIKAGHNIFLGTGHEELVDVAFFLANAAARLHEKKAHFRTGLVLSKALDFAGIDTRSFGLPDDVIDTFLASIGLEALPDRTVPVREFLGLVATHSYMTLPNTKSFEEIRGVQGKIISEYNKRVKRLINEDLSATGSVDRKTKQVISPLVLAVAVSGTKTKTLNNTEYLKSQSANLEIFQTIPSFPDISMEDHVLVLGAIYEAVLAFTEPCITFAGAIDLQKDDEGHATSSFALHPQFLRVSTAPDLEEFSGLLVESVGTLHPNSKVVLNKSNNLPLD